MLEAGIYINPQSLTDSPSMTAAFHAGAHPTCHKPNTASKDRMCVYCKGAHSATNCNTISDHHKRFDFIKREGLCFNCLAKHRVAQCTSHGRCKQCGHKHHTSVCKAYANNRPPLMTSQPSQQHTKADVAEPRQTTNATHQHHPVFQQC